MARKYSGSGEESTGPEHRSSNSGSSSNGRESASSNSSKPSSDMGAASLAKDMFVNSDKYESERAADR